MAAARTGKHLHAPPNGVTTEVRATAKWLGTAPRKAQLVVDEIRGRGVAEARTILAFMPRAAARDVEAVLKSAVANAEANHGLAGDDLYVSAAYVGHGPTLKRWRARARGRVGRIKKRTCHITVKVAPVQGAAVAPPMKAVEPAAVPRRARRPKAEAAPAVAVVETPAVEEAAVEEKPAEEKAARPRRKQAEPAAGAAPGAEETPKPARPRKAAPKAVDEPAEKPKRATRKKTESSEGEKES